MKTVLFWVRRALVMTLIIVGSIGLVSCEYPCMFNFSPQARFSYTPSSGVAPLVVAFDGSSSSDLNERCCGEITSYKWDFGDNETGTGVTITHEYDVPGTYSVSLTVTDSCDLSNSHSESMIVKESAKIFAVSVMGYNVCTPGNVACDPDKAIGPPDAPMGLTTTEHHVSLGSEEGYIVAYMAQPFTDGPGPDLRIYEVGALQGGKNELFDVLIGSGDSTWIEVGSSISNNSGMIYASIDISPATGEFSKVKIVNKGKPTSKTPGADIDAIEGLYRAVH
jgi:PKD repeat protein